MSTSYLMATIMKAEEWQENFFNGSSSSPTNVNSLSSTLESTLSIVNTSAPANNSTNSVSNGSVNLSINNKGSVHSSKLANTSQKLPTNHSSSKIPNKPGALPHTAGGSINKIAAQVVPVPSVNNHANLNNSNAKNIQSIKSSTDENRVEIEFTNPIITPSNINNNVQSNNKPWDKKIEKNKLSKRYGEIDSPVLNSNNTVIVNHVSVNYSNSANKVSSKSNNNNNNNNEASDSTKSKSSTSKFGVTTNQSFKPVKEVKDKVRNELKEFNEMMQNVLKVPKTVLRIIHDSCTSISTDSSNSDHTLSLKNNLNISSSKLTTHVWSCGQNTYGELGLGDVNLRKTFAQVSSLDDKCITSIGAGNEHSLFVTKDGKLYSSGYNDNGQCGIGSTQQVRHPTMIQTLEGEEISQVNVYNGCEHTIAITKDGKIFSY